MFSVGFAELDVAPETRHVYSWNQACATGPIALDANARSLGLDVNIPDGHVVERVELRNRSSSTRLQESDYRIFSSPDNVRYTEVSDWSFSSKVEDGRLVHVFSDLAVSDRYLKISHRYADYSYSFIIDNTNEDVQVYLGAANE